jgi:hypothetical protein
MNKLREFQDAVIVRNVVARFVEAKEFSSPEALQKYLQAHPKSDKSKHTVKKDKAQAYLQPGHDETEEEYTARKKTKEKEQSKAYLKPGHDETEEEYAARKKTKK